MNAKTTTKKPATRYIVKIDNGTVPPALRVWDKTYPEGGNGWNSEPSADRTYAERIAAKLNRREVKRLASEAARIAEEKAQKPVSRVIVTLEWKKSRTWGHCPRANGRIEYKDGTWGHTPEAYANGCGYDKASTVVASVLGACIRYKLWQLTPRKLKATPPPYGLGIRDTHRWFEGGVGMSCYSSIAEYLGGTMDHISDTPASDVYVFTFKR